jgi:serine/threonine protein kinase
MSVTADALFNKNSSIEQKEAREGYFVPYQLDYRELIFGKELGRGGFGVVHQGTWRKHTEVAIKRLISDDISLAAREEFEAESQVMARLRSPHIVQFYGYCVSPRHCIVMEYMPNGSLFSVLRNIQQPLDWTIRIRIATDMASGLAFLHQEHIVHRDIKSLNVLLDKSYGAKLTDFGLSKVKTETKSHSMATQTSKDTVGTLAWMAPELFERRATYTQKSDIYSLGITFWELASRKIPFADASNPSLIPYWVSTGKREEIPKNCPQKLASLIAACWEGSPDKRPDADTVVTYLKSNTNDFAQFLPLFASHRASEYSTPTITAPRVSASDLQTFLRLVAEGEQEQVEAMLKSNPNLALVPGDVTDLSKRTFNGITAFQYAVWALDWHMWTMIRKYLPYELAREQGKGFATGAWVKKYGVDATWILNNLLQAYETTDALCTQAVAARFYKDKQPWSEANTAWIQQVGGAQRLLPAHVINEYCHPARLFKEPLLNFRDTRILPRTRSTNKGEWFTAKYKGGKLSESFAYFVSMRGDMRNKVQAAGFEEEGVADDMGFNPYGLSGSFRQGGAYKLLPVNRDTVRALSSTRTAQREELIDELNARIVQKKTA